MAALDVSLSRGVQQALGLEMVWELAWCLPFDRFLTDKTRNCVCGKQRPLSVCLLFWDPYVSGLEQ